VGCVGTRLARPASNAVVSFSIRSNLVATRCKVVVGM
jgi:hypothetical protein